MLSATGHDGVIVLAGTELMRPRDDQAYEFRVEPYFAYWCPTAATPGAALALSPGRKPVLVLPTHSDFWHAPPPAPERYWADAFDIVQVDSEARVVEHLRRHARAYAVIGESAAADALGPGEPADLMCALDFERAEKTRYEIECIAAANRVAAAGHERLAAVFGPGVAEFDLHLSYLDATRQTDAQLPYPNIVALNEHAAVLHYQHLDRRAPADSRLLLVDAGATHAGYASDITRTTLADASPLADLHASMDALQQQVCGAVDIDVDFVDLNAMAHRLLADVLVAHGLVECSAEAAVDLGLTRLFLPHGLGHLLGLQVHDVGGRQQTPTGDEREPPAAHPYLRLTRTLAPGFVVTIEPGLYFIDRLLDGATPEQRACLGWHEIDRMKIYGGIRIEDDVVVQAGDNRNLTREAFDALDEPEI